MYWQLRRLACFLAHGLLAVIQVIPSEGDRYTSLTFQTFLCNTVWLKQFIVIYLRQSRQKKWEKIIPRADSHSAVICFFSV